MYNEKIESTRRVIFKDIECKCKLDKEGNTFFVNYDYDETSVHHTCSNIFLGKIDILEVDKEHIVKDVNAYFYMFKEVDILINSFNEIIDGKISSVRIPDYDNNILEVRRVDDTIIISVYDSSNNITFKSRSLDINELDDIVSEIVSCTSEDFIADFIM